MDKWKVDVPVLCIFFARPEQFKVVFEQIKKAKPSILLLWQDGPRNNRPDDIDNIMACRKIAEDVDWECEVHKCYHNENMGCDPSTHLSHKWAFSIVDKCIILEDDVVPTLSFFKFCKELLDYYEKDTRIDRICGLTLYGGIPNKEYSYFFSRGGSSTGWATWKRVADSWQSNYEFLDDDYHIDLARNRFDNPRFEKSLAIAKKRKSEGVSYWEHIVGFRTLLNSGLVIYSCENMIENVGASCNATHALSDLRELPKDVREIFEIRGNEIEFPLKHPPYVIEDYHYFDKMMKHINPNIFIKIRRKFEHLFNIIKIRIWRQ